MPHGTLSNIRDCEDFINGCLFMGTGGGGDAKQGMHELVSLLKTGKKIEWIDPLDVPDSAWTCTIYSNGSIAPPSEKTESIISKFGVKELGYDNLMGLAINELTNYTNRNINAIVPVELGAGNVPEPLVTGVKMGIPVVDGDYAGRAVPEEMQSTPYLLKKDSFPLVSLDQWGNIVIIKHASNPLMLERISKMLSIAAFGKCTIAATLLNGAEMKDTIVPGTLTKCLEIGRTIRKAHEQNIDPIKAIADFTEAWILFEGEVVGKEWEDRDGLMFGTTHIIGSGSSHGHKMDVWFMNENQISWIDGKPFVCSPDLITILNKKTGVGLTNDKIDVGYQVSVLGIKGLEISRSEFGLATCGPRYFGFDIDYVPIEFLMK